MALSPYSNSLTLRRRRYITRGKKSCYRGGGFFVGLFLFIWFWGGNLSFIFIWLGFGTRRARGGVVRVVCLAICQGFLPSVGIPCVLQILEFLIL